MEDQYIKYKMKDDGRMERIHKRSYYGKIEGMRDLLNDGVDINLPCSVISNTNKNLFHDVIPLHLACQEGQTEMVKFLMERGADPSLSHYNTKTKSKMNSYEIAFLFANFKCLYFLKTIKKNENLLLS